MQNLGLSDSTPATQSRWKSLAWPSIGNDYDVEYLTRQGVSICFLISGVSLLVTFFIGPVGLFAVVFYYLAGVGIRVRSRFAAVSAFVIYLLDIVLSLRGSFEPWLFLRLLFLALLAANIRATFLAAKWAETRTEPPPLPVRGGLFDSFGDVWPRKIWPAGQYVFYVLTFLMALFLVVALAMVAFGVRVRR